MDENIEDVKTARRDARHEGNEEIDEQIRTRAVEIAFQDRIPNIPSYYIGRINARYEHLRRLNWFPFGFLGKSDRISIGWIGNRDLDVKPTKLVAKRFSQASNGKFPKFKLRLSGYWKIPNLTYVGLYDE